MLCWPRFTSDSVLDGSTINSSWWLLMVLMPKGWICSSRQNIKRCVDDFYLSLLRQSFFFSFWKCAYLLSWQDLSLRSLNLQSAHTNWPISFNFFQALTRSFLKRSYLSCFFCLFLFTVTCIHNRKQIGPLQNLHVLS